MVLRVCFHINVAHEPNSSSTTSIWRIYGERNRGWALFRTCTFRSSHRRHCCHLPDRQTFKEVPRVECREYLIILNLANLLFTGLLQIGNVYVLYIFRVLQGFLVGNFMTLVPTYIGELTPKELGSRFGVYPQISVVLGVLVSFLMGVVFTNVFDITNNTILAEWQWETFWRVQLGIPLLPSIFQLFFILIGYIP